MSTKVSTGNIDAIVGMLTNSGWYRELNLVVNGCADRAVFTLEGKKKTYRVIVEPLWTTYYDINRDVIGHMDSIKTQDFDLVVLKVKEMSRG